MSDCFGPGTHTSNIPSMTMEEFGAKPNRAGDFSGDPQPIGVVDLSDPCAPIRALDDMGIEVQFLFPSTSYAATSIDLTSGSVAAAPALGRRPG